LSLRGWAFDLFGKLSLFKGNQDRWRRIVAAVPQVGAGLELFFQDDPRPDKEKLIEALRGVSAKIAHTERLVIVVDPVQDLRTNENAEVVFHFVAEHIPRVKFIVAQRNDDFLVHEPKFMGEVGSHHYEVKCLNLDAAAETIADHPGLKRIPPERCQEFLEKVRGWPLALAIYAKELVGASDVEAALARLPKRLETEIKTVFENAVGAPRSLLETVALLGIPVTRDDLAVLAKLSPDETRDALGDAGVRKLVYRDRSGDGPYQHEMRHALFAEWILGECSTESPEQVSEKFLGFYHFFRERFGDRRERVDDLMRAVEYLDRLDDEKRFLSETEDFSQQLYTWSLYDAVLDLETKRRAKADVTGDRGALGKALNNIAGVFQVRGDLAKALDLFEESLRIRREVGNRAGEGTTLSNIAAVYNARGDLTKALEYYEQSLQIFREVGERTGEGTTLNNIADVYRARGDLAKALKFYEQSLEISREVGDRALEGSTLNNIACVHEARGDLTKALEYFEQSLQIRREVGDRAGEGVTLNNIGEVYRARGDLTKALEYFEQSLQIFREVGDRAGEGTTLSNIALVYDARGDLAKALEYYEQSLQIFREVGDRVGEAITLHNMAKVFEAQNDFVKALEYSRMACEIFKAIGHHHQKVAEQYLVSLIAKMKQ